MNMKVALMVVCLQLLVFNINSSEIKNEHPEPRYVPEGYRQYRNSGYYKFNTTLVNWYIARQTCEDQGAHLIIVNDEDEALVVAGLMQIYKPDHNTIHSGFNDLVSEGRYMTIYGDPLESTGFTRWNPGEPNNLNNEEDCGSLHLDNNILGLNDLPCQTPYMFVCELED